MPRFVILHHRLPEEMGRASHWDFMLEQRETLWTWALESFPSATVPVAAEKLPDHRLAYLDYEGPISGGRGEVERVEAGSCWIERQSDELLVCTVLGRRLRGRISLEANSDGVWRVRYWPEESASQTRTQ